MFVNSRPALLLLCGLLLLTVCIAALNTLVPLWLDERHLPVWQVGLVSSSYFGGNLAGTLIAGALLKQYGFNRGYYYASALFALAALGLGLSTDLWNWLLWRFLAGVGCALLWVIVESALLCSGTPSQRGLLLAAYMIVYYLGSVTGQLVLGIHSTSLADVLPWITALTACAILPLLCTRIPAPPRRKDKAPVLHLLRHRGARLGIQGCLISGIILGCIYGLLPLYLSHRAMGDSEVGYWMAWLIGAGIAWQWPVGRMVGHYGRKSILRIQVVIVISGCLAMLGPTAYVLPPALFILGGACFTLYPVAMSWACEQVERDELVAMNQALLLSYTIGSLFGPALVAIMMQHYSDNALFIMIAAMAFVYLLMLTKTNRRRILPAT